MHVYYCAGRFAMKKIPYAVPVLILLLLLCSCRKPENGPVRTTVETTTLPTAAETTVLMVTETTAALHSHIYHPDYTVQQIREYFEEVVLAVEYSHGEGNAALVQKWTEPILYRFFGQPTEEDLTVLNSLFDRLNQIPGFPGIYEAAEGDTEQLRLSFLEPDIFRMSYSSVIDGEEASGATEFWYYIDTNEIYSARIGYRTDIDQSIRNSVLVEEIINTLGISDTVLREDSVTYQYSDFNTELSDVDWILLNLLYDPAVPCGTDAEGFAAIIGELYY